MPSSDREKRVEPYRQLSLQADELVSIGKKDEALAILRPAREEAQKAGDEDYRLFFEAEIENYSKPDYDHQIALLHEALQWAKQNSLQPDFFLSRNVGAYYGLKGDQDAAIEWFDRALAIDPKDSTAMRCRGVSLSNKGDEDAAIEWYDKALAINPKYSDAMRQRGVSLSKKGDLDAAIEWSDRALAVNPKDYEAMRNRGVFLSEKGDLDAAIEWFDKALTINPRDYHAMRQRGVSLSKKGDLDTAIEWYDKALAINPKDHHAMCSRGVTLGEKGDLDTAIEWIDKALATNPRDSDAMRERGVVLVNKGDLDAAIEWFDKALAVNPKDYHAMRLRGVSLLKKENEDAAIEWYDKALAHIPQNNWNRGDIARIHRDKSVAFFNRGRQEEAFSEIVEAFCLAPKKYLNDFIFVCTATGQDPSEEALNIFGPQIPFDLFTLLEHPDLVDIQVFIKDLRAAYAEDAEKMLEDQENAKKRKKVFMRTNSILDPKRSLFMVLRRWNSFTPAIPASDDDERSRGGGYFLWHGRRGIVVDPGYNFLENFREAGCRLCDIDDVIITHAHNDHTMDFESICSLLHEFNEDRREETGKRIRLFLNLSAFMKLSGMIDLRNKDYIRSVRTIHPGDTISLSDDAEIRILQAFHPDVISDDQAVGLSFLLDAGGKSRRILLTSDTGLFPQKRENDKLVSDSTGKEIWEHYEVKAGEEPDLMVIHIGAIKKEELGNDYPPTPSEACYPCHLGIIGTARLIAKCRPRLAVVSEFGEEMRSFRHGLIEGLQSKVIEPYFEKNGMSPVPRVVPGDLPFLYDVTRDAFFCCLTEKWTALEEIGFFPVEFRKDPSETVIFYCCRDKLPGDEENLKDHAQKMCRMRHKDFAEDLGFVSGAFDK